MAATVQTLIDLHRQMDALDDGGMSEARGQLNMRFTDALNKLYKVCPPHTPPGT
ncbi:hypothetical protein ACQP1W_01040 [Spirillospora sp. CA-255316]